MGWLYDRDERCEHEGYVVAYVPRDWIAVASTTELGPSRPAVIVDDAGVSNGPWRELGMHPLDREYVIRGVRHVGAACSCGWRSPRYAATAEWRESYVERSEVLDEALWRLWRRHAVEECGRL